MDKSVPPCQKNIGTRDSVCFHSFLFGSVCVCSFCFPPWTSHDFVPELSLSFSSGKNIAPFFFFLKTKIKNPKKEPSLCNKKLDCFRDTRCPNIRTKAVRCSCGCSGYSGCCFRSNPVERRASVRLPPDWQPTCFR